MNAGNHLIEGRAKGARINLSLVTKPAPSRMVSMMMGVWFLSSFVGNSAAGFLGNYWEKIPKEIFFTVMAAIALAAAAAVLIMLKPLTTAIGNAPRF